MMPLSDFEKRDIRNTIKHCSVEVGDSKEDQARCLEGAILGAKIGGKTGYLDYLDELEKPLKGLGYHRHWAGAREKGFQINKVHKLSQKHDDVDHQVRHDSKTGKYPAWVKKKGLHLTDRTRERYIREVLKR